MTPPTAPPAVELDYLEESGPGIPELPPAGAGDGRPVPPAGLLEPPPELPRWELATVEQFLKGTGHGVHMLAGVTDSDWLMTEADLERIAPPLTRIANRYEPLARMAPVADPLLVAHGFALYGWRSALERQRALRDRDAGSRPAAGEGYVRAEEEAAGQGEEPELPGEATDYHEPGYFNGGTPE